ncbi:MAG: hypothetical protein ACIAXF_09620 [Phycisphaerales bacterium JB063]
MVARSFRDLIFYWGIATAVALSLVLLGCGQSPEPDFATAEATLLVSNSFRHSIAHDGVTTGEATLPNVSAEIKVLLSDPVLQDWLTQPGVQQTDWYAQFEGDLHQARKDAKAHVFTAEHLEHTQNIRVTATVQSVADALALLSGLIKCYQIEVESRAERLYNADRIAIQREFVESLAQLELVEARMRAHLREYPRSAIDLRNDAAEAEYELLVQNKEALESQRDEARHKLRELDVLLRRAGSVSVEVVSFPRIVEVDEP